MGTDFVAAPNGEAFHTLYVECDCHSHMLVISRFEAWKEDPEQWFMEINTTYKRGWKDRLKCIWKILRGKEDFYEGTVHTVDQARQLKVWLDEQFQQD